MIKKLAILFVGFTLCSNLHAYKINDNEKFQVPGDCSGCNLTEASFPDNISSYNFDDSFFTRSTGIYRINANNSSFVNANFVYSSIDISEFKNANFKNARLSYSTFSSTSFMNASFINAAMNHSNFSKSNFSNTDLTNANLTKSNLSFSNLFNSNISPEQLKSLKSYKCATLPNGEIFDNGGEFDCYTLIKKVVTQFSPKNRKTTLDANKRINSTFSSPTDIKHFEETKECHGCDLSDHYFGRWPEFNNAIIDASDLHKGSFQECKFLSSNITNSLITSSNIDYANFIHTNFQNSKLDYSRFNNSHLSESSLINTSLKKVQFNKSNLSSADFTNSNVRGAIFDKTILIGSNITKEQLQNAESLYCSVLPNGDVAPGKNGQDC